jgi:hypothetical protein
MEPTYGWPLQLTEWPGSQMIGDPNIGDAILNRLSVFGFLKSSVGDLETPRFVSSARAAILTLLKADGCPPPLGQFPP